MGDALAKILPPIIIFIIGYILKRTRVLKKEDGSILLKLCFYVGFPSIYLTSIPQIHLTPSLGLIFLSFPIITLLMLPISFFMGNFLRLDKKTRGVFLVSSLIMNTSMTFPFLQGIYGIDGIARFSIFDAGSALVVFSVVYFISCIYGERGKDYGFILRKVLISPPIWGLTAALILNYFHFTLPETAKNLFTLTGNLVTPLFMLSLGMYFDFAVVKPKATAAAIVVRSGVGVLLGLVVTSILRLHGLDRALVLVCSGAPIGFNTLLFSTLENLNVEFAASIVSMSVLLGLFLIPFWILIFR